MIRLLAMVVEMLDLKKGAETGIPAASDSAFEAGNASSRDLALDRIRALRRPLPEDSKFHRDEASAR